MRIVIAAVGRARGAPEDAIAADYLRRAAGLGRKLGFQNVELIVVETSRANTAQSRMADEAEQLSVKIPKGARIIALDERGRTMTSEAFANQLAKLRDGGSDIAFVIGGPDGLSAELRNAAHERLALGAQTWPHMLVRAMLAEQIYRAMAILAGHPYHRSG